jgi:hypothetical protein
MSVQSKVRIKQVQVKTMTIALKIFVIERVHPQSYLF